jgi:hypothetical protein
MWGERVGCASGAQLSLCRSIEKTGLNESCKKSQWALRKLHMHCLSALPKKWDIYQDSKLESVKETRQEIWRDTKRYQEIPRDTKRYRYQEIQEIPFGRRYTNGIPLVSFGISWYLLVSLGWAVLQRYQEIPRDTKGIPLGYRLPNGISWYLSVSLGISVVLPDAYPI